MCRSVPWDHGSLLCSLTGWRDPLNWHSAATGGIGNELARGSGVAAGSRVPTTASPAGIGTNVLCYMFASEELKSPFEHLSLEGNSTAKHPPQPQRERSGTPKKSERTAPWGRWHLGRAGPSHPQADVIHPREGAVSA